MKIKMDASYNLDLLCFLNVTTADEYYADRHKEAFETFYPALSAEIKTSIRNMVARLGYSMLAPTFTLLISSLNGFNNRSLADMLAERAEIEHSMCKTPYSFSDEEYEIYERLFADTVIPLVAELEGLGFREFWTSSRLPLIEERCRQVDAYLKSYNIDDLVNQFKAFDNSDFTVFICSFAKPHGIKLCGNSIISDYSYNDKTILSNVTHEIFHPPYDYAAVKDHVKILSEKPWVERAFKNQNPNSGYYTPEGFIEENIVEALGIYVLSQLGVDIEPMEYFKTHDEGSHVVSPYFYDYLTNTKIAPGQAFEDYFAGFADMLRVNY